MGELELEKRFGDDTENCDEENGSSSSFVKPWQKIVKLPNSDPHALVRKEGNNVFKGVTRVGKISFLVHWQPPAMVAQCALHGDSCCASTPLVDGADEDALVSWLADGLSYRNGEEHMALAPEKCYNRRL